LPFLCGDAGALSPPMPRMARRRRTPVAAVVVLAAAATTALVRAPCVEVATGFAAASSGAPALTGDGLQSRWRPRARVPRSASRGGSIEANGSTSRPLPRRLVAGLLLAALTAGSSSAARAVPVPPREVLAGVEQSLASLLKSWDSIAAAGGDSIRQALGGAANAGGAGALRKVLQQVVTEDTDLMDRTEEIDRLLQRADFLLYSSVFCGSAAGGTLNCDKRFIEDARKETAALASEINALLQQIPLTAN